MATKKRKVEVHGLTISGLPKGAAYGPLLGRLRGRKRPVAEMVMKNGEKSHALNQAILRNHRLRLRFLSYTKGLRPDVLDTNQFALQPNPLSETQTNVEWTHALGQQKGGRYVLLVERNSRGIWPSTMERYLQWMVEKFYKIDVNEGKGHSEPVTVTLEVEPGPEFLTRLNAMDRITEATVRIARPNPGWLDLDSDLGEMAWESDARKVDLTATARRRYSLNKRGGIVQWIRDRMGQNSLGYAAIKGWKGRQSETFNTVKLGKHSFLTFELDERGQIVAEDAWAEMSQVMDNLD